MSKSQWFLILNTAPRQSQNTQAEIDKMKTPSAEVCAIRVLLQSEPLKGFATTRVNLHQIKYIFTDTQPNKVLKLLENSSYSYSEIKL